MKIWEIYNYTYRDVCSDSYCGKEANCYTIGFVVGTEENVKSFVDELNEKHNSYWPKDVPADEWDPDFEDADYIAYSEVLIATFDDIRNNPMV